MNILLSGYSQSWLEIVKAARASGTCTSLAKSRSRDSLRRCHLRQQKNQGYQYELHSFDIGAVVRLVIILPLSQTVQNNCLGFLIHLKKIMFNRE